MLSRQENSMMTMTTMADGLETQDSSKSAFMEFGQQSHSQQSSPSMAGGHYPLHCLHSGSHAHHQHDNSPYSGSNTYNRSLPYPYVSHPHHSPYLPSYHNNTGGQTRLDGAGKEPHFAPPRIHRRLTAADQSFLFASIVVMSKSPYNRLRFGSDRRKRWTKACVNGTGCLEIQPSFFNSLAV